MFGYRIIKRGDAYFPQGRSDEQEGWKDWRDIPTGKDDGYGSYRAAWNWMYREGVAKGVPVTEPADIVVEG